MTLAVQLVLACVALPAVVSSSYLLVLTLLSRANPVRHSVERRLKFDIVVPAHNEQAGIGRTIASLSKVDWPKDLYRIVVVADNCTDPTASIAADMGATVLERTNPQLRGKGYALAHAFEWSRGDGFADAVVVIDADAEVSSNLLDAIAARLEASSSAVQVHYGVRNPNDSWRTRLLSVAKGSFIILRSRARERLGLSCGIRGNGWCVTHELLGRIPYAAFSLTEDLEYGIQLGLAGVRVAYADEAHSDADMVSSEKTARSQRRRWEQGRFALVRTQTWPLLGRAAGERSAICLDLAMDLLVLPLSYVVLNAVVLVVGALLAGRVWPGMGVWLATGLLCLVASLIYVLRGWQLSGTGMKGLLDLARAPWFVLWKLIVTFGAPGAQGWVRTGREKR